MVNFVSARSDAALRRLVRHAYANVPYYRRLFDACGLDPRTVRSAADLAALPITTKADLQRDPDAFVSRGTDPSRLIGRNTSGSTGQPVVIRTSAYDEFRRHLARWRVDVLYGVRPGDRRARLRMPRPLLAGDRLLLAVLSGTRLYRQQKIDSRLTGDELLSRLREFRPTIFDGMANSIDRAAQAALEASSTDVRPRYVVTGGDTITPEMRRRISTAFQTRVYDIFGAMEFGVIAYECPKTGLYHLADGVVTDVVRPDGSPASDGEDGTVIATSLLARAVPVIRYRTGDRAVRGPDTCPCGARVGTLRSIIGRERDVFRLSTGREVHPSDLPMRITPWIRTFQLEQQPDDRFLLRLVPSGEAGTRDFEDIRNAVHAVLGPSTEVAVEIVDALVTEPNGKQRPYVALRR